MPDNGTLHDAFLDELRDLYDSEKQLTKALPKLAKTATSPTLRDAFESHLEETRGHIERLEQAFEGLGEKARGKHCDGIAGIIEEGKSMMEEDFDDLTMDACLIAGWTARRALRNRCIRHSHRVGSERWATNRLRPCCKKIPRRGEGGGQETVVAG